MVNGRKMQALGILAPVLVAAGLCLPAPADAQALHVAPTGNVGVGTLTPGEAVDVIRSAEGARFQLSSFTNTANEAPQYIQRRARGTANGPVAISVNDVIGRFSFRGYSGSGFTGSKASIAAQATENWTSTRNGTRLVFGTTENGTSTLKSVMEITHDGKVLINGVQLNVPDYVFDEDYDLMPLDELAAFVEQHRHLPGVASAEEVTLGGLDVAQSQMSVLEKVEELTLYTLQQQEQLNRLSALLEQLNLEMESLRSENERLRGRNESLLANLE
jgi:hypothetical protein